MLVEIKKHWWIRKTVLFLSRKLKQIILNRRIVAFLLRKVEIEEMNNENLGTVFDYFASKGIDFPFTLNPDTTCIIAKIRKKVLGFCQLVRRHDNNGKKEYWLFGLSVTFLFRGFGLGRKLVEYAIRMASEENARELFLLARQDNIEAIRWYNKLGFVNHVLPHMESDLEKEIPSLGYRRIVLLKKIS